MQEINPGYSFRRQLVPVKGLVSSQHVQCSYPCFRHRFEARPCSIRLSFIPRVRKEPNGPGLDLRRVYPGFNKAKKKRSRGTGSVRGSQIWAKALGAPILQTRTPPNLVPGFLEASPETSDRPKKTRILGTPGMLPSKMCAKPWQASQGNRTRWSIGGKYQF